MTARFHDYASIDFPVIDADAHVNEPPDLWAERVPEKWRRRAPTLQHTEHGDVWVFDEGKQRWPVGLTATAGLSYFDYHPMCRTYETMRPSNFDTAARLSDMDADGIFAQILYPSVTLKGARIYSQERELQIACVDAYNDWLADFCSGSNGRLIGQALIPTTGLDDAVAGLEAAIAGPHRGAVISSFPNGSLTAKPEDERFWAIAEEAEFPIAIHIGSFLPDTPKSDAGTGAAWTGLGFIGKAAWTKAGGQTLGVVCDVLFSGIFEKFPGLAIVLVEANIGWIPTLLEQADDMFRRYRWYTGATTRMSCMPSEVFHRNFYATFIRDTVGVELRHRMNLDHLMWSTDFPHSASDWPESRLTAERVFHGVPMDEVAKMLHGNCKRLYKLDHIPDKRRGD